MKKLLCAAAATLFAATPAFAATTLIDFETATSFASIDDFYNGGADSAGKAGPALGVSFGDDALAVQNDDLGLYFSNAPSPLGVMAPVGVESAMNVAAGFTGVGFSYASSDVIAGGVQAWSGLDGTGTLLASFDLSANAAAGCSDSPFCHFDAMGSSFASTAHSLTFGNAAFVAAFDNVTITAVPEPSTVLLMCLGLGGLMLVRRRRG
jgi:hypothetical protein